MIKTGQEKSSVEITIENYEGHSPIVIKREFTAKESNWTVNNKRATESKIKDIRTKFNIQLDNLCHFAARKSSRICRTFPREIVDGDRTYSW